MQTGLIEVDGESYYIGDDYLMDTGWVALPEGYAWAGEDGALVRNRYVDGRWIGADGLAGAGRVFPDR